MSGRGVPQWYGSAEGRKYGKRDRYTDRWGNARYMTRRKDGSIVTSVNIAGKKGAVANDRRSNAVNYAKPGYRQMGDAKPVGRVERAMKNMFGADGEYTVQEQGLPVIPDSYGTNSALSSGQGVPQWYGSAEGKSKYGRRQRFTTSKGNSRYVARNSKGEFIFNVAVAGKRGLLLKTFVRPLNPTSLLATAKWEMESVFPRRLVAARTSEVLSSKTAHR